MRVLTLIAVCLLGVLPAAVLADDKDDRNVWAYDGGWFSTKDGKTWIELSYNIYNDNDGKPLEFQEVKRTRDYVEIYDAGRKLSVRLSDTQMEWKEDGKDEWNLLYKGGWKKRE